MNHLCNQTTSTNPIPISHNDDQSTASKTMKTTQKRSTPICQLHRQHRAKSSSPAAMSFLNSRRKSFLFGIVFVTLALLLVPPLTEKQTNSVEAAKTLKALAKTFVFQRLTQRKHFVPLPVPIPVPIEINEKPIYLKGKPKYVNVYKPKPTAQPVTKPTTVYHMPIYSPTYEYMSMDPISSMYSSPMIYGSQYASGVPSYKTAASNDADSASSSSSSSAASASHSGVDYDDDPGSYYMRKAAARRNKLAASEYGYDFSLHRNDYNGDQHNHDQSDHDNDSRQSEIDQSASEQDLAVSGSNTGEDDVEAPDDNESIDHEKDASQHRVKRQVYYQSGYDGPACEGFPLEINVRSRIKMDRIFPIHGKSQIKKCVKFKKSLLPPVQHEY